MQDVSKHIYTSKIKSGKFYGHPNFVTLHVYSYTLHKSFFFYFFALEICLTKSGKTLHFRTNDP